jgi:hypothetical protein
VSVLGITTSIEGAEVFPEDIVADSDGVWQRVAAVPDGEVPEGEVPEGEGAGLPCTSVTLESGLESAPDRSPGAAGGRIPEGSKRT